jgi:hypothetical protein
MAKRTTPQTASDEEVRVLLELSDKSNIDRIANEVQASETRSNAQFSNHWDIGLWRNGRRSSARPSCGASQPAIWRGTER